MGNLNGYRSRNPLFVRGVQVALSLLAGCVSFGSHASELDRLRELLTSTPEGGWVRANLNSFSSAWATGTTAVNIPSFSNPGAIVTAWSSFAWDSTRGDLLLWGGGHANYAGNEMYIWDGQSGLWSRGSLPSRLDSNLHVVDGAAPQSAHTYDNNLYLRNNDMFLTFGGAAFQSGGNFADSGGRTGPWMWDPRKADPNRAGGTNGSGYDVSTPGGNMWVNRQGHWTGTEPPNYVNGTTAYKSENGRDVIYLAADRQASGFPTIYRYTVGDVRSGESDRWDVVGRMFNSYAFQGAATLDTARDLYIRTVSGGGEYDLAVWELSKSSAGVVLNDVPIELVFADGTDFSVNGFMGVEYDSINDRIVLWDGVEGGTVYAARVLQDPNGNIVDTWLVEKLTSTTPEQPTGSFITGVLGKWEFIPELGAFLALDEFRAGDAGVWLYKPFATAVPEPGTWATLLAGLLTLAYWLRRRIGCDSLDLTSPEGRFRAA